MLSDDSWSRFRIDPVNHRGDLSLSPTLLPERHQVHVLRINSNEAAFQGFPFILFGDFEQEPAEN
jgi:hypothetical protein